MNTTRILLFFYTTITACALINAAEKGAGTSSNTHPTSFCTEKQKDDELLIKKIYSLVHEPVNNLSCINKLRYENSCWKEFALIIKNECGRWPFKPQAESIHRYDAPNEWFACIKALRKYLKSPWGHPSDLLNFFIRIASISILKIPGNRYIYCINQNKQDMPETQPFFIDATGSLIDTENSGIRDLLIQSTLFSCIKDNASVVRTKRLFQLVDDTLSKKNEAAALLARLPTDPKTLKEKIESSCITVIVDDMIKSLSHRTLLSTKSIPQLSSAQRHSAITTDAVAITRDAAKSFHKALTALRGDYFTPSATTQKVLNLIDSTAKLYVAPAPHPEDYALDNGYKTFILVIGMIGLKLLCTKKLLTTDAINDIQDEWCTILLKEKKELKATISLLQSEAAPNHITIFIFEFMQNGEQARLYCIQDFRQGRTEEGIFINEEGDMFTKEDIVFGSELFFLGRFGL